MLAAISLSAALHLFAAAQTEPSAGLQRFEYSRIVMGVRARVVLYSPSESEAASLAQKAFDRLEEIESQLSDYRVDSAVSRLNAHPRQGLRLPPDLAAVLSHAENVRDHTGGAFNPYLGSLTLLWRGFRDTGHFPTQPELEQAGLGTTSGLLQVNDRVTLTPASTRIDLGAIGKGYAADEARETLSGAGSPACLVALAGDIAVGNPPPGQDGWTIALGGRDGALGETILLSNACVSTSGDSVQFVEHEGKRYSHIIDPTTGFGCTDPWQSTVVAPQGWQADSLSTALCVTGPSGLSALAHYPSAAARIIRSEGNASRVWATPLFPPVFKSTPAAAAAPDDDLNTRLAWFREARFGMFIHWGLYAIPAGSWNGKPVPGIGEWIMNNAQIPPAEYEKLAPQFNPVNFNADDWMQLAKDAGMKYFVITTKHHDGFCLFDSAHTTYDIMDAAPFKRDVMKELSTAARKRDLRVGWYHSIMDWHHPDAKGDRFPEYEKVLRNQVGEILTKYGPIDVVWFDGEWISEWTPARGRALYDHCRQLAPKAIINNRVGKGRSGMAGLTAGEHALGDFGTPEQEVPSGVVLDQAWESCMTMNDTWGFRSDDHNFKSTTTLVRTLIETVSKGGNFLLNVGPTADGRIPEESIQRLREMGQWMKVNSESIYGKTAAPFKKTPFGRTTFGDGKLYLHLFDLPRDFAPREVLLPGLVADFASADFLADPSIKPTFTQTPAGVVVKLDRWPHDPHAAVLRMTLKDPSKPLRVEDVPLTQPAAGAFTLAAADAEVLGRSARFEKDKNCIGYWMEQSDRVVWQVRIKSPGPSKLSVTLACEPQSAGAEVEIILPGSTRKFTVPATKAWDDFITLDLGTVTLPVGDFPIEVRPLSKPGQGVMNLRALTIAPVKPL
ncbi:MAG: alpha-L-fucosidase [Phycisphaerales bacterium]